jgi:hypothetical protein
MKYHANSGSGGSGAYQDPAEWGEASEEPETVEVSEVRPNVRLVPPSNLETVSSAPKEMSRGARIFWGAVGCGFVVAVGYGIYKGYL